MKKIGLVFWLALFMVNFLASVAFAAPANLITDDARSMAIYCESAEGKCEIWKKVSEMPPIPAEFPIASVVGGQKQDILKIFHNDPATKISATRQGKYVLETIFPEYSGKMTIQNWELTMVDGKFISTQTGTEEGAFNNYLYLGLIIATLLFLSPLIFSTNSLRRNLISDIIAAFASCCTLAIYATVVRSDLIPHDWALFVLLLGFTSYYLVARLVASSISTLPIAFGIVTLACSGLTVNTKDLLIEHASIITILMSTIFLGRYCYKHYKNHKEHALQTQSEQG